MILDILIAWIPLILVLTIWIGFGIYFEKKIKKHKAELTSDTSRPNSSLTLVRGIEPTNYFRKYIVFIDGKETGKISSGETKHFDLEPGRYSIQIKIDWCESTPINFEIMNEKNTELVCGANYNDWRCTFMWMLKPASWIYVK